MIDPQYARPSAETERKAYVNSTFVLKLDFTPLKPGPSGERRRCVRDTIYPPPIMERIKAWKVLHSGDTLKLTADGASLFCDDQQPGTPEFNISKVKASADR